MDQEYSLYGWHYSRLHQACEVSPACCPPAPIPFSDYHLVFDVKIEPNFKLVAIGCTLTCNPWPLQDGNLEMLEERLDKGKVDLNEPSYTPVPYTPLFIAFMNDHYQVGG